MEGREAQEQIAELAVEDMGWSYGENPWAVLAGERRGEGVLGGVVQASGSQIVLWGLLSDL